jgi:acyl-CoA thioester hydrolase
MADPPRSDPEPFVFFSTVHFDELDAMKMLHNARFAVHVERATVAFYESFGRRWQLEPSANPDQFQVVREVRIEFLAPFLGTGALRIELWVERLGRTSCVYGFRCASETGDVVHARGTRAIVKLDPKTLAKAPWSEELTAEHEKILRRERQVT